MNQPTNQPKESLNSPNFHPPLPLLKSIYNKSGTHNNAEIPIYYGTNLNSLMKEGKYELEVVYTVVSNTPNNHISESDANTIETFPKLLSVRENQTFYKDNTITIKINGVYYTHTATTAGTEASIGTNNVDATVSICPKSWRLSKARDRSDSPNNEFYNLSKEYKGSTAWTDGKHWNGAH